MSIVTGVILLVVVRYTTPQRWVETARARMTSAIYETRLFLDDPKRVLIAQGRLLAWSAAYITTMLPAFVVVAVPLGLLYLHLDARHGLLPLPMNRDFVVRVELVEGRDPGTVSLGALPEGITATAAPVRSAALGRVYFRLRATREGAFELPLRTGDTTTSKRLVASTGDRPATAVSPVRGGGLALLWLATLEPPLDGTGPIASVSVAHEGRTDTWLGMPWWLYWLLVATLAALVLKKPLRVTL